MDVLDAFVAAHPYVALGSFVAGVLLVLVTIAVVMDRFMAWAESDRRPHPYNERNPSHCDACWREGHRRRQAEIDRLATPRQSSPVTEFPGERWRRI